MRNEMKHCLKYLFTLGFVGVISAQNFSQDLGYALNDVLVVTGKFVQPAAEASVYLTSSSWAITATSLPKFKVDVSVNANTLPITSNQKKVLVSNSDFKSFVIRGGSESASIPSSLGGDATTFFDFPIGNQQYEMQSFDGVGVDAIVYPYVQASVGLWRETELTLRVSPSMKIDKSKYHIYGVSLKHNLTQYHRKQNTIETAVLLAYSKFDLNLFFNAFNFQAANSTAPPLAVIDGIVVGGDMWMFQFLTSKRKGKFEFLGALGLTTSKFDYKLSGEDSPIFNLLNTQLETLSENKLGLKADVGVNYHFSRLCLASTVTLGNFVNVNLGVHYKL